MRYTELFANLRETHPEWDRRMCVIAARYYLDVETHADLEAHTEPRPIFREHVQQPLLTIKEANDIIGARP